MTIILEVALGLACVYLLFSLFISAVNEAVLGHLTQLRARVLDDGLKALLSDKGSKSPPVWDTLKAVLTAVRRIFHVFLPKGPPRAPTIPANDFAENLLNHPAVLGLITGRQRSPNYIPPQVFVDAALGTLFKLVPGAAALKTLDKIEQADVAAAVQGLKDPHAKGVFESVFLGVKDLTEARTRLATWFNQSMERVSGLYKRYTQFWLCVWAFIITAALNLDTIEITKRLLADAQFRGALVAAATNAAVKFSDTNTYSVVELRDQINQLKLPIGWAVDTNAVAPPPWPVKLFRKLTLTVDAPASAPGFFQGWTLSPPATPKTSHDWWLKIFGLVITMAAISQGAPFWFDLLNKITNVRAVGRPPKIEKQE
jgi:hypothetical protein